MIPSVWAPFPQRVALVSGGRSLPMERGEDDWWRADVELEPGTDYAFSLDGWPAVPDPRSRHQPYGVHGPSRVVRPEPPEGRWKGFELSKAVLYELHVGTFTPEGTFAGVIERLDHLVDLGVGAVELMPVAQFPGSYGWGYDGVCLYAPHDPYGGPEGLRALVAACHERGLGVVLDVVYNHLGPDGNYLGRFGPYFTDLYRTPWGDAVNLDGPGSDEVRRFFVDNALMWLEEYGVDGLRLDAVHAFHDRSAVPFLEELSAAVDEVERRSGIARPLIAESDLNDPRLVLERERGGTGLEAAWSDDFHHALHSWLTGEEDGYYADFGTIEDVAEALRSVYVYAGRYSPFRGRRHGRPVGDVPRTRFLGYLQSHDQVGNRARGERIGHLVDRRLVQIGAALVLTSPFVPMLFQGEEWGASTPFPYFSDHENLALREAVSRGRLEEFASFGWAPEEVPDPTESATYHSATLDWKELGEPEHAGMLAWYRDLVALRNRTPDLTDGAPGRTGVDVGDRTLVVRRGRVTVAVNFADTPRELAVPRGAAPVLSSTPAEVGEGTVRLGPESVSILLQGEPS